jgi:hypothetical protein
MEMIVLKKYENLHENLSNLTPKANIENAIHDKKCLSELTVDLM